MNRPSRLNRISIVILLVMVSQSHCWQANNHQQPAGQQRSQYQKLCDRMVKQQIELRGVQDKKVLRAMRIVPRHEFVPTAMQRYAYQDRPLPIGNDQTISQPYIVAFMTEALRLKPYDKVLEIGTGSGYQAAILAAIVDSVYSIEIIAELSRRAMAVFERLGYSNIMCKIGDGYRGWPAHAPFDAIIVTAAPSHIPQPLIDQLKPGGRLVIPVGVLSQKLLLIEKDNNGKTREYALLPVRFVPMTGEAEKDKQ